MDYLIDVMKVVILLLVGFLVVSMLFEVWSDTGEEKPEHKKRRVQTLEETRETLWTNYIYHFH